MFIIGPYPNLCAQMPFFEAIPPEKFPKLASFCEVEEVSIHYGFLMEYLVSTASARVLCSRMLILSRVCGVPALVWS